MVGPVATWTGEETLFGITGRSFTVIFKTSGCAWNLESGGCLMCGYSNDSDPSVSPDTVARQLDAVDIPDGDVAKLYTSGSFLDPREISFRSQREILDMFSGRGYGTAVVETRPEFVTQGSLDNLDDSNMKKIELAFGLESADDRIRRFCVNKGFTWDDFSAAAGLARDSGFGVRVYLLLKPPFISEAKALDDLERSLDALEGIADVVSINPTNIQKGTRLEDLFRRGFYRPPWYWTLFRALEKGRPFEIVSFPSGGGSERGIHNCKRCDQAAKRALNEFNVNKDPRVFATLSCGCRTEWVSVMEHEPLAAGNINYRSQNRDW